jgi:hypothetical protein
MNKWKLLMITTIPQAAGYATFKYGTLAGTLAAACVSVGALEFHHGSSTDDSRAVFGGLIESRAIVCDGIMCIFHGQKPCYPAIEAGINPRYGLKRAGGNRPSVGPQAGSVDTLENSFRWESFVFAC